MQGFAAGHAAARAVDRHDHGLDLIVVGKSFNRVGEFAVFGDQALDRHPRDMGRMRGEARAAQCGKGRDQQY